MASTKVNFDWTLYSDIEWNWNCRDYAILTTCRFWTDREKHYTTSRGTDSIIWSAIRTEGFEVATTFLSNSVVDKI